MFVNKTAMRDEDVGLQVTYLYTMARNADFGLNICVDCYQLSHFLFFFSFRLLTWQKNVCISRDGTYFYAWCVFGYFVQLLSHRNLSPNKGWVKLDLMTTTPLGFPLFSFYPHPQREKIWNFVLQNQ